MTAAWHEHAWVPTGHVMRCGDPDCTSWVPLPLPDPTAAGPAALPPRKPKPKATPHPAAGKHKPATPAKPAEPAKADAVSNVVALTRNRKVT